MEIKDIFLLSIALAADASAVAICKSTTIKKQIYKSAIITGLYFGSFQAIMPFFGYCISSSLTKIISKYGAIFSFIILLFLGINMIREKNSETDTSPSLSYKIMIPLSIATSLDALATGITLSLTNISIKISILIIGIVTFLLSFLACILGNKISTDYGEKAKIIGGIILMLIGIKLLIK